MAAAAPGTACVDAAAAAAATLGVRLIGAGLAVAAAVVVSAVVSAAAGAGVVSAAAGAGVRLNGPGIILVEMVLAEPEGTAGAPGETWPVPGLLAAGCGLRVRRTLPAVPVDPVLLTAPAFALVLPWFDDVEPLVSESAWANPAPAASETQAAHRVRAPVPSQLETARCCPNQSETALCCRRVRWRPAVVVTFGQFAAGGCMVVVRCFAVIAVPNSQLFPRNDHSLSACSKEIY